MQIYKIKLVTNHYYSDSMISDKSLTREKKYTRSENTYTSSGVVGGFGKEIG